MPHQEGVGVDRGVVARPCEDARLALPLGDLGEVLVVAALRHAHLLVEQVHEAVRLGREELDDGAVVDEGNLLEGHTLGLVEGLLLGEGVRVELLLQLLVGEVDAQLLEGVDLPE